MCFFHQTHNKTQKSTWSNSSYPPQPTWWFDFFFDHHFFTNLLLPVSFWKMKTLENLKSERHSTFPKILNFRFTREIERFHGNQKTVKKLRKRIFFMKGNEHSVCWETKVFFISWTNMKKSYIFDFLSKIIVDFYLWWNDKCYLGITNTVGNYFWWKV